ncbi:unnamed protein product [Protopolystoma xenopodis]|uniref:Uncharacterized protein n=1 Tax=Protopolystoma xenopodis TaxID=117903 RepID=A0A3S5BKN6_9PLAT|nr:unnamed protein product [Protopolystoma xenopodis]
MIIFSLLTILLTFVCHPSIFFYIVNYSTPPGNFNFYSLFLQRFDLLPSDFLVVIGPLLWHSGSACVGEAPIVNRPLQGGVRNQTSGLNKPFSPTRAHQEIQAELALRQGRQPLVQAGSAVEPNQRTVKSGSRPAKPFSTSSSFRSPSPAG